MIAIYQWKKIYGMFFQEHLQSVNAKQQRVCLFHYAMLMHSAMGQKKFVLLTCHLLALLLIHLRFDTQQVDSY